VGKNNKMTENEITEYLQITLGGMVAIGIYLAGFMIAYFLK